jgi:hypothetical protein
MDNPEIHETFDTRYRTNISKTKPQHKKQSKKMNNTDLTKNPRMNPGAREWQVVMEIPHTEKNEDQTAPSLQLRRYVFNENTIDIVNFLSSILTFHQ